MTGNKVYKKYVFDNIQKIFDYKLSVEDFLDKMDVTYDNSLDSKNVKKMVNRINKIEHK